jgi:putative nucleotidyltransferase with HDIG domain
VTKKGWIYRAYVAAVLAAVIGVLALVGPGLGRLDPGPGAGQRLILWLALSATAALAPIPAPWSTAGLRWSGAVALGSILIFGPATAAWFAAASGLCAALVRRRQSFTEALLGAGTVAGAILMSGTVYLVLRGSSGTPGFRLLQWLPLFGCAAVYCSSLAFLQGTARSIRLGTPLPQSFRSELSSTAASELPLLPFGALLATAQIQIGSVAVALFLIPLLLTRYAFILWTRAQDDHLATVRALMSAVDAATPFTRGHSLRISKMSSQIARKMGLSEREVATIEYAALLHDVGRTALRSDILLRPGKLSEGEYKSVRSHPRFGYEFLRRQALFKEAAEIVYSHHEQPDGQGYPRGLTFAQVPMGSRIIMVVAAFDAMTTDRPYRPGLKPEAAFKELLEKAGSQFYSDVVELLIHLYSTGELFRGFDARELPHLASTESNRSQAIRAYLERSGLAVPDLEPDDDATASTTASPTIEMPPVRLQETFDLGSDGRWRLVVAGRSDLGCVRNNNEDSFGAFPGESTGGLLVLADGMGGAAAGEVASRMAVDMVRKVYFEALATQDPQIALIGAIQSANHAIFQRSVSEHRFGGMGTTCTALAAFERGLFYGHVGDSRAYLIAGGEITLLTQDHTVVAEMERAVGSGQAAPEMRHVLTRCLGSDEKLEVDSSPEAISLEDGDTLVICSDGLSSLVESEEILAIAGGGSPEVACQKLVQLARDRGGPDNISVQVARVEARG